jgi:hypothetical protein
MMHSWLKFGPISSPHEVEWIWYSPDGAQFNKGSYSASGPLTGDSDESRTAWWSIPLAWNNGKNTASNMPGNWRVDIYIDGQYILSENFVIGGQGGLHRG